MQPGEVGPSWVVCGSETRIVRRGRVACPARRSVSPLVCRACRLLMTSSSERDRSGWCELPPKVVPALDWWHAHGHAH